ESFDNIKVWLQAIDQHSDQNVKKLLIGNKCDLTYDRVVGYATAKKLADSFSIPYVETSAKRSTNVEQAFKIIATELMSIPEVEASCSYYRDIHGIILAFDVTNEKSFENINKWLEEIDQQATDALNVLLVGNKCDLTYDRLVGHETAKKLADSLNIPYIETSAKNSTNVEQAFQTLTSGIISILAPIEAKSSATNDQAETKPIESNFYKGVDGFIVLFDLTKVAVRTIQWHGQTAKLSIDDVFYESYLATIGVDFKIRKMNHNGKTVKLQMWDTAGDERFRTITSNSLVINVIGSY
ncbi:unnamed protein product, partial [Rotaria sp. Silwood1]